MTNRLPDPRARRLLVLLAAAGLVVAACSSSGGLTVNPPPSPSDAGDDGQAQDTGAEGQGTEDVEGQGVEDAEVQDEGAVDAVRVDGRWTLDSVQCAFGQPAGDVETRCYDLTVPERWDLDADSDTVSLHVALFEAPSSSGEHILYLEGGPGGDALRGASLSFTRLWAPVVAEHRLVIFDQRGTGSSRPSLQCDEVLDLSQELSSETDIEVAEERTNAALGECAGRLRADGVDFAAYNSVQSAHDIEALRQALDVDQWNLLGISYGTRLAQTAMREHPDAIRSAVLDAVLPIDGSFAEIPTTAQRSFGELFTACAGDAACSVAYPNLENRFWALVDQLNAAPIEFAAFNPTTADRFPARWSGSDLVDATFAMLYSRDLLVDIPALVEQLERGVTDGASALEGLFVAQEEFISTGMFWSVACHEEVPHTTADEYAAGLTGDLRFDAVFATGQSHPDDVVEICGLLDGGAADPVEDLPLTSVIPALVLSGQFDPITPPEFGQDVADDLSNSTHVVLPATGHSATSDECGRAMILAFVTDPVASVDDCSADVEPLSFVATGPGAETTTVLDVDIPLGGDLEVTLPGEWVDQGGGLVTEETSVLRQGVLFFVTVPSSQIGIIPGVLIDQLGAETGASGSIEAGGVTWAASSATVPGSTLDIWAGVVDGVGVVVVLQSPPAHRQRLVDTVMPTVLATVSPS